MLPKFWAALPERKRTGLADQIRRARELEACPENLLRLFLRNNLARETTRHIVPSYSEIITFLPCPSFPWFFCLGTKNSTQTFFCTKFFDNPSGHGRPRRKSWTSAPKSAFACGPGGGEKLFDPWASGCKGQECLREIRTKKFMFMLFFFPDCFCQGKPPRLPRIVFPTECLKLLEQKKEQRKDPF